ncbi:hypothetical protein BP5796_04975 [Coleophoma crateriformis]|uniref:Amino acid transporter transmembrane domain-containing protein n=1 Tax=Coleophoma crateriformis TaxID=565419 RepID=A0A3D8SBK3_9HELO|nr:hypothetical protein BP5796_04975 [Coleophoma crateriformis]
MGLLSGISAFDSKQQIDTIQPHTPSIMEGHVSDLKEDSDLEQHEVFKQTKDGVNFRTVTWQRAIIIFLKVQIATGVLGIPGAMYSLGAVGGAISIVGWQFLNLYTMIIVAEFRNRHPECHTLVDMCGLLWGPIGKEVVGLLFIISFILCTGSGILGISVALNALSDHGACSVGFSVVGLVLITMFSSIRTWDKMTWPMTAAFISVISAVLVVVIGVTFNARPAAAPQTGPFELGFNVIAYPTFAAGMVASATIFVSSACGPNYLVVIAEMKNPKDYKKAAVIVAFIVSSVYLSFSMVIYYYCGQWVATPSLGSAGPLLKKVAYGIAFPSLVVSGGIFNHTSAKYMFVRFLRKSEHLQKNSWVHWSTWIGCNLFGTIVAFILASSIPIFNYLLALTGSVCFAPMCLIFPICFWLHDYSGYWKGGSKQLAIYAVNILIMLIGLLLFVGGTYGTVLEIKQAYASGSLGSAFSCADNSNTVSS